jgi:small subunit ribosomal protein S12
MTRSNSSRKIRLYRKTHKAKKKSPFLKINHIQNAMVVDHTQIHARQPNSGDRKVLKVQLVQSKAKKLKKVYIPYCGGKEFIKVHDVVTIQSIGGGSYRAKGDLHGLNFQVIKVNGVSLKAKFQGLLKPW